MNQEIIQFNREFPVGIEVNLLPISKGSPVKTTITQEARRFFGANVVSVAGEKYPVNISRIQKVRVHVQTA